MTAMGAENVGLDELDDRADATHQVIPTMRLDIGDIQEALRALLL